MANILDKAIAAISPEKGYRRAVARAARGGSAAREVRTEDVHDHAVGAGLVGVGLGAVTRPVARA